MFISIARWILIKTNFILKPDLVSYKVETHPYPKDVTSGKLFVVVDNNLQKWACLECPCGCGDKLNLSLSSNRRPAWTVKNDYFNRPTLNPSIRQTGNCLSHFWVTRGKVEWCADTGISQFQ